MRGRDGEVERGICIGREGELEFDREEWREGGMDGEGGRESVIGREVEVERVRGGEGGRES